MPIDYYIDHAQRVVVAEAHGTFNASDVFGYQREVWSRSELAGYSELIDMSEVKQIAVPSPPGQSMQMLAAESATTDAVAQPSKFAIFAPSNNAFGLGRMYQTYRELDPRSTRQLGVFRNLGEALAFLKIKPPSRTAPTLETTSLRLVPLAPGHLLALLEGVPQFDQCSGLHAAEGLRDMFASEEVSATWLAQLRAAREPNLWTHGFAVVQREGNTMLGSAAFKGPPNAEGMVEIAYGVAPGCRGRGYATEAATALVDFAFGDAHIQLVRAHTLPTPNASTRVLTKCGFKNVGEVVDPEDGPVWRWERGKNT